MDEDTKTLQAAFDKAVMGIVTQRGRSTLSDDATTCAYRGDNGRKCAVGHLISNDQMFRFQIKEGQTPDKFPSALIREILPGIPTGHAVEFLEDLQNAHDSPAGVSFLESFKEEVVCLANKWGLNCPCK